MAHSKDTLPSFRCKLLRFSLNIAQIHNSVNKGTFSLGVTCSLTWFSVHWIFLQASCHVGFVFVLLFSCILLFHKGPLHMWLQLNVCSVFRCPVCRYCQTPEPVEENKCFECGVQEVDNISVTTSSYKLVFFDFSSVCNQFSSHFLPASIEPVDLFDLRAHWLWSLR